MAVPPRLTIDGNHPADATTFYKIVITRGAAAADATLSDLSLGAAITLVPKFSRHTYRGYSATVPNSVGTVTVTPADNDDAIATYQYKSGTGALGTGETQAVTLLPDTVTRIAVEVTSADGKNTKTYTIDVTRLGGGGPTDTTLSTLTLTDVTEVEGDAVNKPITLSPPFSSAHRDYTATVEFATSSATVAGVVNADQATLVYRRDGEVQNDQLLSEGAGVTIIKVRVTARDRTTSADYTITVTRKDRVVGTDATLSMIVTSPVLTLEPAPNKDVIEYEANVAASVTAIDSIIVTPTDTDTDTTGPDGAATVTVKKGTDTEAPFTLEPGDNVFTIEVTAEDGTTKKLYTLTVKREGTSGLGRRDP